MRIATWNVNSLKVRLERVQDWLLYTQPDVLCLQETKIADKDFPFLSFLEMGYESVHHGTGRYNGVAILSRVGLKDVQVGFPSHIINDDDEYKTSIQECRIISANCAGIEVSSIYVPNGRSISSQHYQAKLAWLKTLHDYINDSFSAQDQIAICGDFNIAPQDKDVWDPALFIGATHVSEPERQALQNLQNWGLHDGFRKCYSQENLFSWWDYRAGNFHKHHGMRIDLILLSNNLIEKVNFSLIDRNQRKGKLPSDHAPVFVDIQL